jgi:hypothetical protein
MHKRFEIATPKPVWEFASLQTPDTNKLVRHVGVRMEINLKTKIEIVYNMYRVKPVVVYGPSLLCL